MSAPFAAHSRLPTIEREQAKAQTALIAALNHRHVETLRTIARGATTRDRRGAPAWIRFDTNRGPIMIAPLLVDNQLARMTSGPGLPDGAAAAATLGRIEPLVAALETILGVELHPAGLLAELEDDPALIRLDAHERGGTLCHRLLIAAQADVEVVPLPLPRDLPARIGALSLRWSGEVALPPIPARRLAALEQGDCILFGIAPLTGALTLPGRTRRMPITIDLRGRTAMLGRDLQEEDTAVPDRVSRVEELPLAPTSEMPEWAELKVAATIEFDGGRLTAAQLATLGEGSVLPLPATGGTLAVRIIAGGAPIAEGELVAVGEGYGVLVTAIRATDAAD
ncbi:hypothetical protein HL653_21025 [Sphingomonas sp. AP4-R1]|uniref:FliM/FliN family flagellar motor switch protein n=1 Tax=Sphingomonas sp. AP4-R1 TaxID=2735134 RepID=UPI001493465A|nr:FliM/FliN family flagellar motor switch protein [Sphingomonas sp. AP4-R1]QJU59896.1 hypothetical protein HL653_21025 [Sphingomonas sp. AP4-R1]